MMSSTSIRRLAIIAILVVSALPCLGSEVAVLKNGFSIKHERRQVRGDITRLYINAEGSSFVDVPTAEIEHFEAAPDAPPTSAVNNGARPASTFPAAPSSNLAEVVNEASGRYRLDPDLVNSVIKAESDFHVRAVSPKGAEGLMQLMPGTASQLGVSNTFDPEANVEGGTRYLRELLERYNFDLVKALAAYNAGPRRVEQFGGVPPYYETRAYVARIVKDFNKKKMAQEKASGAKSSPATTTGSTAAAARARQSGNTASAQTQPAAQTGSGK
jgi:soluble lytic murein transglycosylase-like protein